MSILVDVNVKGCDDRMHPDAARAFNLLRETIKKNAGFDFLGICGDILRAPNYESTKDGVAKRSWHKTGRAFDYDQTHKNLVIQSEIINGKQFFRTYLICAAQDGSRGAKRSVKDMRGHTVTGKYLFDFTEAAERRGFKRIPAWNGWQKNYNRREFWHYQYDEGLTWDAAMQMLKANYPQSVTATKIIGLNDRGETVKQIQTRLNQLGLLPKTEIDGVFGAKTRSAVIAFQKSNNLSADGIVGMETNRLLKAF